MTPFDPTCIFCKIAAGQIPCQRVFENGGVLAFLDIAPVAEGHTVVIPKVHAARLEDLPAEAASQVASSLGTIARRVTECVGAASYNVLQNNGADAGQVVMHVHFHIIPRRGGDGLGFRWNANKAAAEHLAALAARIRGE